VLLFFARGRGVRALAAWRSRAPCSSAFLVPALLHDQPAVPVTLAAAALIAFAASTWRTASTPGRRWRWPAC
jgi:hypothetical protein